MADGVEVVAKVCLAPHQRSHQFQKREVVVSTESAKIGRSVARTRILPSNLIFDCRVLSRSHALIWFENGKDTKSSNGTFVNDRRLSRSSEESPPYELKSGDVVQFGVNVEGPSRVTHGCIIGTVRLWTNDKEQLGRDASPQEGRLAPGETIDEREIEEALRIVQTAYRNETELEAKLTKLQEVISTAQTMAGGNMMAIVKEDQLLSRLEMMENQLQLYTQDLSEDDLKGRLSSTLEEKLKCEQVAKDKIHKLLEEKAASSAELAVLKQQLEDAKWEVQRLANTIEGLQRDHNEETTRLTGKLKEASEQYRALEETTTADQQAMTAAQEELRSVLHRTKEQLESVKAQLEDTQAQLNKANEEKKELRKKLLEQSMGQHRNWEAPLPLPAGGPLTEEHVASLICESVILKGQLTLMEEAIAERDLQVKQLKAKMGDSVVSFRPQRYQGDDADLIGGKNQDGAKAVDEVSKDLQKKCLELQRKLKAKEKEEQVLVKSLSTENEGLKKSNAQLLKEVTQWKSKCSELLKSSEGPGAGGGGGGPSGAVGEGGTSPLAAQSGGDDANPLISALIWCSVGVALASAFYYYINRGG